MSTSLPNLGKSRLYVDNGANYRSQYLAPACARLDIGLIHARPYYPAGKSIAEAYSQIHLCLDSVDYQSYISTHGFVRSSECRT